MNKMITIVLVLLFSVLVFTCKKDESNPTGPKGSTVLSNNTITGKIENWTGGSNKVVVPMVGDTAKWSLGSGPIASDGSFSLHLSAPDSSSLENISSNLLPSGCTGANISDPSAKIGSKIEEFAIFRVDTLLVGYGYLYRASSITYTFFIYVDRNCTITGNTSCGMTLNLSFTRGWNLYAVPGSSGSSVTSTEPSDSKWIFYH